GPWATVAPSLGDTARHHPACGRHDGRQCRTIGTSLIDSGEATAAVESVRAEMPDATVGDHDGSDKIELVMQVPAGLPDPRVVAGQRAKMAARLQAATSSSRPVLLRVGPHAGHGRRSTREQHNVLTADLFA